MSLERRLLIASECALGETRSQRSGPWVYRGMGGPKGLDHELHAEQIRRYVLDSFAIRAECLGSIESHPDFE